MSRRLRECTFLIPIRRDSDLSDGDLHGTQAWEWLRERLWELFDTAGTIAPGLYEGGYQDSDTQQRVYDQSRKYILAVSKRDLSKLRDLLKRCLWRVSAEVHLPKRCRRG